MKKIIRLTESELIDIVKRVLNEETSGCGDPVEILKDIPESFARFALTVASQQLACGSKCPTVKGNDAQSFANKYTEKVEYLWGGIESLYHPEDLYMFDEMNNEILNLILEKYDAPWRVSMGSKPRIIS
jgi:hypothetical protein